MPSIKQVLPAERINLVGAFFERPRANAVRSYKQKDREQISVLFHTPCSVRYSVLHLLSVLSGGNEPPFTQGSLWFVRLESPSTFLDKHCFCGHKSSFYVNVNSNCIIKKICVQLIVEMIMGNFFEKSL